MKTASAPPAAGSYGGTNGLGRRIPRYGDPGISLPRPDRKVGIFYFLWHGEHGTDGPYDMSRIIAAYPDAPDNPARWGGGGAYGVSHWWGEPLFGYYTNRDRWVLRKHVELLTDAGIDFLVCDATNAFTYSETVLLLLEELDRYAADGWPVPQVAFYTNSQSGRTINKLYDEVFRAHPEFRHLWFRLDGKPMVVGLPDDPELRPECRNFFRIKHSQWPDERHPDGSFRHHPDGFPWICFEEKPHLYDRVHPTMMNVSVAQHCGTVRFSSSALYGDETNHGRNWHDGANDHSPDAVLHGYNLAEQFEYAISRDPELLFITGWNEWVASNFGSEQGLEPVLFVDCCGLDYSRDIEMMKGGYGDNYYLQMISLIRRYKGCPPHPRAQRLHSIDIAGGFGQWEAVECRYADYAGDTAPRHCRGYGGLFYENRSGRNDFVLAMAAHDRENLYFYIETREAITPATGPGWMNLFLVTGRPDRPSWLGYDFLLNRLPPEAGDCLLEQSLGGWSWQEAARCRMRLEGSRMHLAIPLAVLGLDPDLPADLEFKWSDNQQDPERPAGADAFYTEGDAAPGGRLNYLYSF